MTYRMRNILIAVALAGFAALLVVFYVSNYKKSVQHQQAAVTILVAGRDIPVPGDWAARYWSPVRSHVFTRWMVFPSTRRT